MGRSKMFRGWAAIVLGAMACVLLPCLAAWSAPTTIVDNGPPSNRADIVFLGDGYTQTDLDAGVYDQHIQAYLDHMFSPPGFLADPFPRYRNFFNVHKITVASNQSGADIPSESSYRDTALDATYDSSGIDRLLTISNGKANNIRNQQLAGTGITADIEMVTVNHTKYGGSGGSWAVFAGGNTSAHEIALHELGHSFSGLADEYVSFSGPYPYGEPAARNVTKNSDVEKWSHWRGFVDVRGSNLDISAYEGAAFYPTGIYRPSLDSKMRSLGRPFDAVSREALIHDIYQRVDPLDDWLDNFIPVIDEELWVDVVDPAVILLEWSVDGTLVPGATGSQFNPADFGYGPGTYTVEARAYDGVLDHAFSGGLLDLVRSDPFFVLEQSITWTLTLTAAVPGDYDGNRVVDMLDYDAWQASFGSSESLAADGNDNGRVDSADYAIWRRYSSAGAGSAAGATVPEPMTGGLAIISFLVWGASSGGIIRRRPGGNAASVLA